MQNLEDVLRLASVEGVGPRTYRSLIETLGSVDQVLGASRDELSQVPGMRRGTCHALLQAHRYDPRPELEEADRIGVQILHQEHPQYPAPLLSIYDPPILLYCRGTLVPSDRMAVGVVGTRGPSHYGRAMANRFASELSRLGFAVVSGLARGVDSVAHRSALRAGGRTLAVLGSGLGCIYPEENADLVVQIAEQGAVLSEFPLRMEPAREHFPRRNRLIAGLSLGTLVVEAPHRSGSLITARMANEMGREVFAIPGRVDQRNAEGGNHLIQRGEAKLVTRVEDLLEEFGPMAGQERQPDVGSPVQTRLDLEGAPPTEDEPCPLSAEGEREEKILLALEGGEMPIDGICAATGLVVAQVSSALMLLELKRRVRRKPGRVYAVL
ncbi:MAG: DNA-processing protein DprA [Planctomycetota bacterium]